MYCFAWSLRAYVCVALAACAESVIVQVYHVCQHIAVLLQIYTIIGWTPDLAANVSVCDRAFSSTYVCADVTYLYLFKPCIGSSANYHKAKTFES